MCCTPVKLNAQWVTHRELFWVDFFMITGGKHTSACKGGPIREPYNIFSTLNAMGISFDGFFYELPVTNTPGIHIGGPIRCCTVKSIDNNWIPGVAQTGKIECVVCYIMVNLTGIFLEKCPAIYTPGKLNARCVAYRWNWKPGVLHTGESECQVCYTPLKFR